MLDLQTLVKISLAKNFAQLGWCTSDPFCFYLTFIGLTIIINIHILYQNNIRETEEYIYIVIIIAQLYDKVEHNGFYKYRKQKQGLKNYT